MTVNADAQSARTLNASLRTPGDQLDATITELKALGRLLVESRTGEEVTQQSIDLDARLTNARTSEQRLIDLLKHRTDKLSDILQVEEEISETRGRIEQMEAERRNLDKRVQFARIDLSLTEVYEPTPSRGRLRGAAFEGYTRSGEAWSVRPRWRCPPARWSYSGSRSWLSPAGMHGGGSTVERDRRRDSSYRLRP